MPIPTECLKQVLQLIERYWELGRRDWVLRQLSSTEGWQRVDERRAKQLGCERAVESDASERHNRSADGNLLLFLLLSGPVGSDCATDADGQ